MSITGVTVGTPVVQASGTSIVVPLPSNAAGDLIVVGYNVNGPPSSLSAAGYTEFRRDTAPDDTSEIGYLLKPSTGGEASMTISLGDSQRGQAIPAVAVSDAAANWLAGTAIYDFSLAAAQALTCTAQAGELYLENSVSFLLGARDRGGSAVIDLVTAPWTLVGGNYNEQATALAYEIHSVNGTHAGTDVLMERTTGSTGSADSTASYYLNILENVGGGPPPGDSVDFKTTGRGIGRGIYRGLM